ncbi:type II secretory pathway pseudopilin PulG [Oxalobacteraceae bacterium GrIS 1.18]
MLTQRHPHQKGFTYLGLIILVTIIGLVATMSLQVGALVQRRDAENELLLIGREYVDALQRYYNATPAGQPSLPTRLDDLLLDPRFPDLKHHLRKLYIDPMTGNNEWGVLYGSSEGFNGIIGIYSLSEAVPIKQDNFESPFDYFKGKKSYRDWIFARQATDVSPDQPPVAPAPNKPGSARPPAPPPRKPR